MEGEDPCLHFDMGHTMMATSFHFGYCENVLFSTWKIRNVGSLVGSMFGIIAMAVLYEGLKAFREQLIYKNSKKAQGNQSKKTMIFNKFHTIQTLLHVVQMILSYFLMLIVMYFNTWLFFSVVIGATLGYYIFGWRKIEMLQKDSMCASTN